MTQRLTFTSATPRFGLPLLFPGQAQKEFFVNEAHMLLDALVHTSVLGIADSPPTSPSDGDAWLVGPDGLEEWSGKAQSLAIFTAGGWRFLTPQNGLQVYDSGIGQFRHFDGVWKLPSVPILPTGGALVDAEARAAIIQIATLLRDCGLLARDFALP